MTSSTTAAPGPPAIETGAILKSLDEGTQMRSPLSGSKSDTPSDVSGYFECAGKSIRFTDGLKLSVILTYHDLVSHLHGIHPSHSMQVSPIGRDHHQALFLL